MGDTTCFYGECLTLSNEDEDRVPFFGLTTFSGAIAYVSMTVSLASWLHRSDEIAALRDDSTFDVFSFIFN